MLDDEALGGFVEAEGGGLTVDPDRVHAQLDGVEHDLVDPCGNGGVDHDMADEGGVGQVGFECQGVTMGDDGARKTVGALGHQPIVPGRSWVAVAGGG